MQIIKFTFIISIYSDNTSVFLYLMTFYGPKMHFELASLFIENICIKMKLKINCKRKNATLHSAFLI